MRHRLRMGVSGAGELMPLGCSQGRQLNLACSTRFVDGKPAKSQTMSTPHSNEQLNVIVRERYPAPCTSLCESHAIDA
jgi:hypothetical protein